MATAAIDPLADRTIRLRDGRRIQLREFGASNGWPVLALHGTPGSRFLFEVADRSAQFLGLRLIAPDRWGYGGSDAPARPTLGAWESDAEELADALRLDRFSLLGISGGGPYATAVAARLGDRVDALALAVPVGPIAGPPSETDLGMLHRLIFRGLGRSPSLARGAFSLFHAAIDRAPHKAISLMAIGHCRSDRQILRSPEVRNHLARTFRAGLSAGVTGAMIDMQIFSSAWGIEVGKIAAATRIWIGDADRVVPLGPARRLGAMIPGAEVEEMPGRGHFWIAADHAPVLEWLKHAGD